MIITCTIPEQTTPIESQKTDFSIESPKRKQTVTITIENTFIVEKIIEGSANFFIAFETLQNNAVSDTKSKKGNIILPRLMVMLNLTELLLNPDAINEIT